MPKISEQSLEEAIEQALLSKDPSGSAVHEAPAQYGEGVPGGYQRREPTDYDRSLCLIPQDVLDFIIATQPKEWNRLKEHHGSDLKQNFLRRLAREVDLRGTLHVLRKGVKDSGCKFRLAFFRPSSGLNEELRRLYEANLFSVVRQLRYSESNEKSLDLAIFLNGLPIFTAELKNPFNNQNVHHATKQYRLDRDPREPLFQSGRCLAHFAVDPDLVYVTTELAGTRTRFLPFNRGNHGGAGNPPVPPTREGYATDYLWKRIWAKDSVLNLLQHFVQEVEVESNGKKKEKRVIFPRYHQLDTVRGLIDDAEAKGTGHQYLIEHSAGSGKSFTIAWLAHQLSILHDEDDKRVFDSIVVITDRRILDKQLQDTVLQFEQTLGVVENIDQTSRQLKEALESGKTIIVSTLQKFPVIVEEIGKLGGQRFALIVDEAHSSQAGESTAALKKVLAADSLEAAEREDVEEEDLEDKIVAEMKTRGRLPNVSTFAFTATPKPKTLELFGTEREDGKFEPFSLYSMRQAIEEGFILDVLENYTTYKTYWKLLKTVEEDPHYDTKKASYLLRSFVDLHPHAIGEKVKIMVEHFHENVAHRIGNKAKAMIVTRSRLHAVRFRVALDEYLREQEYDYGALVAFSGTVKDPDLAMDYTESGMNGFSDNQTAQAFNRPEYRFLVVANKFQTGFDQPLLHTMYVDKKLGGVNAVQTLSRLNRIHPEKDETMVLDFVNEADEIQKAFEPYYEKTLLSEATDPNLLYDLEHQLYDFEVFTKKDVDEFAEVYFREDSTQAQLYQALDPIADRAKEMEEERLADLRSTLEKYVRQYAFLAQILPFADADLEKLYQFARLLRTRLPVTEKRLPKEIQDKINMDSYRVQQTHKGGIKLPRGHGTVEPIVEKGKKASEETLEPLSRIIQELNDRFGTNLGPEDRITLERIQTQLEENEHLKTAVEVNTPENARLTFDQVATDRLQTLVEDNFKLYKKVTDDRDFGKALLDWMFDEFKKKVVRERAGYSAEEILEEIELGESRTREFKSSLRWHVHAERNDDEITHSALKTIAAFQNTDGGVLLIGVDDDGEIVGIEHDGFPNADKFLLHLNNVVRSSMGDAAGTRIDPQVVEIDGKEVCRVDCMRSAKPVYMDFKNKGEQFFVRTGPATAEMSASEMYEYIHERFAG